MERRHDSSLMDRLEDAAMNGCSHITWNEIYAWYGVKKIAANTYRDLSERWKEVSNGKKLGPLMYVNGRAGMFIFGKDSIKSLDPDAGGISLED